MDVAIWAAQHKEPAVLERGSVVCTEQPSAVRLIRKMICVAGMGQSDVAVARLGHRSVDAVVLVRASLGIAWLGPRGMDCA